MKDHIGQVVWLTGLSGAGKSTLCIALAQELRERGHRVHVLDGDDVRRGLCSDLGFSLADRAENVRRVAHVASMLACTETIVLVALISPLKFFRDVARENLPGMLEVFVDAPLAVCEHRDPKGLYKKVRAGELPNFTGIDSPFEAPLTPDVVCRTDEESIQVSTHKILFRILGGKLDRMYNRSIVAIESAEARK